MESSTTMNLPIHIERIRPSTVDGCDGGVDMDVHVTLLDGSVVYLAATLLPPQDRADPRPYSRWGQPDNWLSDPSCLSDGEIVEVAEACEHAARVWEAAR